MAPKKRAAARKLTLLFGTVKGVLIYETDARRTKWKLSGPHFGGWEIFSLCGDARDGRILAGAAYFGQGRW